MSIISLSTTWLDGQILTASALNGNFNDIVNNYNGGITDANIDATASIQESKLLFSGSGHNHTGGTQGSVITKNASYGSLLPGVLTVANDLGINPRVRATTTATRISAYGKVAPTGQDAIVRVYNITQNNVVATLNITAGSQTATSTVMTNASLVAGDYLRFDGTQVGSGVAGTNITLQLDGTE